MAQIISPTYFVDPFRLFRKREEVKIEELPPAPLEVTPPPPLPPETTPTPVPVGPVSYMTPEGFPVTPRELPAPEVPEIEEPTILERAKEVVTEVGRLITPGVEYIKEQPITVFPFGPTIGEVITPTAKFVEEFRERFITEPYKEIEKAVVGLFPEPTIVIPEQKIPIYTGETGIMDPFTGEFKPPREITIPEREELKLGPKLVTGLVKGARLFGEIGIETAALPVTLPGQAFAGVEAQEQVEKTLKDIKKETYEAHLKVEPPEGFRSYTPKEFDIFWKEELAPKVREDIIKQAQFQVGVATVTAGTFVGLGLAARGLRVFKPKVVTRVGKPIQWTREVQVVTPAGRGIGAFEVYGYAPPTEAMVTTPFREAFRLKPKIPWTPITRPKLEVFRPFAGEPVVLGAPYVGELAKVPRVPFGLTTRELEAFARVTPRRTMKIIEVTGVGEPISPTAVMKLPRPERYVWTGREGMLVTTEAERLAQARIGVEYIGKIKRIKKREFILEPYEFFGVPGKRTQQFYTAARVKPLYEVGPVRVFGTEIAFKETTFPFYRAVGRVPRLPGTLIQVPVEALPPGRVITELLPAPKLPGPPTLAPAKLTTPFQWLKQVPKAEVVPKPIPKPFIPKPKPTPVTKEVAAARLGVGFPLMVGRLGITVPVVTTAEFVGVAPAFAPPITEQQFIQRVAVIQKPVIRERLLPRVLQIPIEKAVIIPKLIPKLIPRERIIPRVVERLISRVRVIPRITPKIRVAPPAVVPVPVPVRPVLVPGIGIKLRPVKKEKKKRKRRPGEQFFIPEVRRFGRFIPVGKPAPRKKALEIGVGKLRQTLAAALRLRRPGTKEYAKIARETREFRPGKKGKDIFVLVQKAPYRLGTRAEVTEIIKARKAGGAKFFK